MNRTIALVATRILGVAQLYTFISALICATITPAFTVPVHAQTVTIGTLAPAFTLTNALGQSVNLESFRGKTVVLEWFNPGCPFVNKFYTKGDMQGFQQQVRQQGAQWLTINSSAPGKQGHIAPTGAAATAAEHGLVPANLLLDPDGSVGRQYGAKTTPHIFVIDSKGILAYSGAIDNTPSTRQADIAASTNYAISAVKAIARGERPSPSSTDAYGCSVKY